MHEKFILGRFNISCMCHLTEFYTSISIHLTKTISSSNLYLLCIFPLHIWYSTDLLMQQCPNTDVLVTRAGFGPLPENFIQTNRRINIRVYADGTVIYRFLGDPAAAQDALQSYQGAQVCQGLANCPFCKSVRLCHVIHLDIQNINVFQVPNG